MPIGPINHAIVGFLCGKMLNRKRFTAGFFNLRMEDLLLLWFGSALRRIVTRMLKWGRNVTEETKWGRNVTEETKCGRIVAEITMKPCALNMYCLILFFSPNSFFFSKAQFWQIPFCQTEMRCWNPLQSPEKNGIVCTVGKKKKLVYNVKNRSGTKVYQLSGGLTVWRAWKEGKILPEQKFPN